MSVIFGFGQSGGGGGGSLVVGTTPISGGTANYLLADNGGTLIEVPPGRIVLTADQNYYVATTGSDSNPGTMAQPWATLQHAFNFITQRLDIQGFNVFVNVAAGTYDGFQGGAAVGGGNIQFYGAGSGSTTINATSAFGDCFGITTVCGSIVAFNGFTFNLPTNNTAGIATTSASVVFLFDLVNGNPTDIVFNINNASCNLIETFNPATNIVTDLMTINITGSPTGVVVFNANPGYIQIGNTITIDGTMDVGPFAAANSGGEIQYGGGGISGGTVTGQRFTVEGGSAIIGVGGPGSMGPTLFPGSTPGFCDASSGYDGFQQMQTTQGGGAPTTADIPFSGYVADFTDGSGNYYRAVNASGTIKKVTYT